MADSKRKVTSEDRAAMKCRQGVWRTPSTSLHPNNARSLSAIAQMMMTNAGAARVNCFSGLALHARSPTNRDLISRQLERREVTGPTAPPRLSSSHL